MLPSPALEEIAARLAVEFEGVLPPDLVARCVEAASPHRAGTVGLAAVERTAREDLSRIADAVAWRASAHLG